VRNTPSGAERPTMPLNNVMMLSDYIVF